MAKKYLSVSGLYVTHIMDNILTSLFSFMVSE
jgi:hypothetical protein